MKNFLNFHLVSKLAGPQGVSKESPRSRQAVGNHFLRFAAMLLMLLTMSVGQVWATTWSFAGGHIYFDNSLTQWQDEHLYLVIGKSTYTSVYPMLPSAEANLYVCALPHQGWGDAEYMAVIGHHNWTSGSYGSDQLTNATHYTGLYTAGLTSRAAQGFLLTPTSTANGASLSLTWRGDNYGVSFSDTEKNNCQKVNATDSTVTIIFSTSSKRFNTSSAQISKVYAYGSISMWNDQDEAYRLYDLSTDGCLYRTFRFSEVERPGNSGQPEFLFNVFLTDGSSYKCRSHSSWTGGIDSRLVFVNNGENMMIAWPGDDLDEFAVRKQQAQYVRPLSDFVLTDSVDQHRISNFRAVPGTTCLFRSYHPYKPDRAKYDTEHMRLFWCDSLATAAGIRSDIALSGNETGHVGETYTCGGQNYTITIPAYYQAIIDNDNVCYVGTNNDHTPSFDHAVFQSNGTRYAEWIQEVVEFIIDDAHPAPFQIHCSLGADRTGMFCATIAAMCGADWQAIAANYAETSHLQIQEYRHPNVVRYCLKNMTGMDPATCSTAELTAAVRNHFIDMGYLTEAQINKMVDKLNGREHTMTDVDMLRQKVNGKFLRQGCIVIEHNGSCYDILGQKR